MKFMTHDKRWLETICYEHPGNELIRVCLRFEHLYNQYKHFIQEKSDWSSRAAIDAILEMVNLLDRSDLKNSLVKELSRQQNIFTNLQQTPHVDHYKLTEVLNQLDSAISLLANSNGKFAQGLRENEFLNSIRLYRSNPAGLLPFDVPHYHLWLNQPYGKRTIDINYWVKSFDIIGSCIKLLLKLVRHSAVPNYKNAENGRYHANLDGNQTCQLVRIELPKQVRYFPAISVSRQKINIRFMQTDFMAKPRQIEEDILFKLYCCNI